jgi:hypothetical protein
MVENVRDYHWSSYRIYVGLEKDFRHLVDATPVSL